MKLQDYVSEKQRKSRQMFNESSMSEVRVGVCMADMHQARLCYDWLYGSFYDVKFIEEKLKGHFKTITGEFPAEWVKDIQKNPKKRGFRRSDETSIPDLRDADIDDELKPNYEWKHTPSFFICAFTCEDGSVIVSDEIPKQTEDGHFHGTLECSWQDGDLYRVKPFKGCWKKSLQVRPDYLGKL